MDILSELSQLPTGIFTVLMGLVVLYWILFLIGSLDLDFLGGAEGLDGAAEGAAEAAAEGAAEAAAEAASEGAAEGAVGLLHALKLRTVPVTIALSFIAFFAWVLSWIGMRTLGALLPDVLAQILVFVVAALGGVVAASFAVRPFARLFRDNHATRDAHLVGKVVTITTGRVDARFGQATCETGGASLILEVRARPGSAGQKLTRGDQGLLIDYDGAARVFYVEPADPLLIDLKS